MFTQTVSISAAFLAGLLSFLSPCVLPLIPAYFTFITGFSIEELTSGDNARVRRKVILSTLSFVSGFSLLFILLGASASFIGGIITDYRHIIEMLGGLIIILFGCHLIGWLRIGRLNVEKRVHMREKPLHLLGTFIVGMAFGAGWSPCIGPMLGSILIVASSEETVWQGVGLLAVYAAGLAIPFILISIFINFLLVFIKRATRLMGYVNKTAGGLLILVGVFLLTRNFAIFSFFMD
ncbi:MAG: sulfite exporter TauE/SafE family protein [Desulfobacterales bacterium]|nr:sulfite exporter TauE/SafE family protein [Desulfobacterales bacterium]